MVANGSTTLTSVTGGFTAAMIGNLICLEGGTGTLARTRRQITGHTDTNTITVDATVATGTGITGKVGGCLATPGEAFRNAVGGNDVWVKAGTYSVLSNSTNIATGKIAIPAAPDTANYTRLVGYTTTRGDGGRFTFNNAVAGTADMISCTAANGRVIVENVAVDCASTASVDGIIITSACFDSWIVNCKVSNAASSAYGIQNTTAGRGGIVGCEATGCAGTAGIGAGGSAMIVQGCYSHDNTCPGFRNTGGGPTWSYCIADSNSGAASNGFTVNAGDQLVHCVSYNNGQHGFDTGTSASEGFYNCLAYGNAGWGWSIATAQQVSQMFNCSGGNNTSGNYDATKWSTWQVREFVALTADPFTDAAGGNFTPNDTTPGGKDIQSSGHPQTYPGNSTTGRPTIGSAPKGGGGSGPGTPPAGGGGHVIGS